MSKVRVVRAFTGERDKNSDFLEKFLTNFGNVIDSYDKLPKKFKKAINKEDFSKYQSVKILRAEADNKASVRLMELEDGSLLITDRKQLIKPQMWGGGKRSPFFKLECFVATAVYGDINHPSVEALRDYRDNVLSNSSLGKVVINVYYSGAGERVANFIEDKAQILIKPIKNCLDRVVENYSNRH